MRCMPEFLYSHTKGCMLREGRQPGDACLKMSKEKMSLSPMRGPRNAPSL